VLIERKDLIERVSISDQADMDEFRAGFFK
jgi:hypothetical protein